jgi:integrase
VDHLGYRHGAPAAPPHRRAQAWPAVPVGASAWPARLATTDPRDICPETGRTRLGYDRARILLGYYADGLRLHQLRHSSATHLGEANVSASVIMAKTGHKSLRSVQRYVKPGLAAVHAATETLSSPRRRG